MNWNIDERVALLNLPLPPELQVMISNELRKADMEEYKAEHKKNMKSTFILIGDVNHLHLGELPTHGIFSDRDIKRDEMGLDLIMNYSKYKFTDETYDAGLEFLSSGQLLENVAQAKRFKDKWQHFKLQDGTDDTIVAKYDGRIVVPTGAIDRVLGELMEAPNTMAFGRDKLFKRAAEVFIGISRCDVVVYLQCNHTNQLHQPIHKIKVKKPIRARKPHEWIQADLIDLSQLHGFNTHH
ncbi:hypothetical protein QOT17_006169 [Balamuthia mandrillaris]